MTRTHEQPSQVLYRHTKRQRWGLAVLAWDHIDKRGYQFEDGKLRIIKYGYYKLLEEVDPPADETMRVLEHLNRALGRREAVRSSGGLRIPFAEQVAYFKEQYPDGFNGKAWTRKMRGRGAKKALKRHRDPAAELAHERLAAARLRRLLVARRPDQVIEALVGVLEQTSLVTAAKLKPLRSAPYHRQGAIALALQDLLHGDGAFPARFEAFVSSIGAPSWELATAPMALMRPDEHLCVRPSVFKQQALWMAPRLEHRRAPTAETYQSYLRMARAIVEQLEQEGLSPRDLLDVHDFVYATLSPAARKLLAERARRRSPTLHQSDASQEPGLEAA